MDHQDKDLHQLAQHLRENGHSFESLLESTMSEQDKIIARRSARFWDSPLIEKLDKGDPVMPIPLAPAEPLDPETYQTIYSYAGKFLSLSPSKQKSSVDHTRYRKLRLLYKKRAEGTPFLPGSPHSESSTLDKSSPMQFIFQARRTWTKKTLQSELQKFCAAVEKLHDEHRRICLHGLDEEGEATMVAGMFDDLRDGAGRKLRGDKDQLARWKDLLDLGRKWVSLKHSGIKHIKTELANYVKNFSGPPTKDDFKHLDRDLKDVAELIRRAELGTFPFDEHGNYQLPSVAERTKSRTKKHPST